MMEFKANSINETIRSNLEVISSILSANPKLLVSDSLSSINSNPNRNLTHPQIRLYYPIIRKVLQNIHSPFKIIDLYTKLINADPNLVTEGHFQVNPIFDSTFFDQRIHWLLTFYLEDETPYTSIQINVEKIVDVFYKFMYCEHGQLMEERLKEGKWFFEEGLEKMFKKYYFTAHDFTLLVSSFMVHGLSALFVAAICILGKKDLKKQMENVEAVKIAYTKKYNLE